MQAAAKKLLYTQNDGTVGFIQVTESPELGAHKALQHTGNREQNVFLTAGSHQGSQEGCKQVHLGPMEKAARKKLSPEC